MIEAPPRHGKSMTVSQYLPAWFVGLRPRSRVMLAAYEATFARSWGRKARKVFEEHAAPAFGRALSKDNQAADDWSTTEGGGMTTAGVGGPMTGRGADLLIIDDPVKNAEEALSATIRESQWDWWQSTASTRLEPGGKVIMIMTRWHEDDLFGRLLKSGQPIRRLTLPAIAEHNDQLGRKPGEPLWPERFDRRALDSIKSERSGYWWEAMYQQRPGKWGDSRWGQYLGETIWAAAWPETFEVATIAVDPSLGLDDRKGDYSAIVFAGLSGGKLWIDADISRRSITEMAHDSVAMCLRYRTARMALEANGFQMALSGPFHAAAEAASAVISLTLLKNTANKINRIDALEPLLSGNQLRFRDTPGSRLLVDQLAEFPRGDHDDGPDALEMAVRGINEMALRGAAVDEYDYAEA